MLRVVLDPGVLVSAVLTTTGAPAEILDRWREGEFDLVVSPKLLDELESVLPRPKFRAAATEDDVREYVDALAAAGLVVRDPAAQAGLTAVPQDDYLVSLAAAEADILVSGDSHLTELERPPVPVLNPRQFLNRLGR